MVKTKEEDGMMANPSPRVADCAFALDNLCREIAKKWKKDQVIIIALDLEAGTATRATYGKTKPLCSLAQQLGDKAYEAVMIALREAE